MVSSKKLSRFSETLSSQVISVGIDVHKKTYSVCLSRSDGIYVEEEAYRRLVRRRNQITDSVRKVKHWIKAVLLSFGIKED